jgi:threonine dehydrogenase-like Zn-dependent dehydrogenase
METNVKNQQIVFTEPGHVALQTSDFDVEDLAADEVVIKTYYSLVSPGTELACLRGTESWARLPFVPGYAGCGEVVAVGSQVTDVVPGDMVFAYTKHAQYVRTNRLITRVPDGIEPKLASFVRMAAVAMTALRVSDAELGDHVAVLGLGLVGNLCAQLFTLAGCDVIGIDLSSRRVALAETCGCKHAINATGLDIVAQVAELTHGGMCQTVVEAIGDPAVGEKAAELAGKQGEVILLGTPRREHEANVTALLSNIHLWGAGCVTYKGAHEWRYPVQHDPNGHTKHSIQRNVDILFRLLGEGRLHVQELLTHVLPPQECAQAYEGLRDSKDQYVGVVFDWRAQ